MTLRRITRDIRLPAVYNVKDYGAVGDNSTDDTTAIQNALNAVPDDDTLHFEPGKIYKITSALTWPTNTAIDGHGATIRQATTSANALVATDGINLSLRDITMQGATAGSPTGAGKGILCQRSGNPNTWRVNMERVIVHSFGGNGIELSNPITSVLTNVETRVNGGHGFYIHGVNPTSAGTSISLNGCFANDNAKAGYQLDTMIYCDFSACAADNNGIAYEIINSQGISFNGCGAETQLDKSGANAGYAGYSWKITGGSIGVALNACYTLDQPSIALWVTGSSVAVVATAFTEIDPHAGATQCIKTDSGTAVTMIHCSNVTANSLTSSTLIVNDGGGLLFPGYIFGGGTAFFSGQVTTDSTVRPMHVATGSRPSATTAGAGSMMYDTTLSKPIWSNGTVWKDAAGTTV